MLEIVQTPNAPAAVGPYSQAIVAGDLIFCAGQIPLDPFTGEVVLGIEEGTHQVLKNLKAVIEAAGSDLEHVTKTTIYLKSMADYAKVNEIYGQYFTINKPARATVQVAQLPKDVLVEIDAIAVKK